MDTSREDCSRSMRRICRTGATPIRTAHDEAAVARTVWAMALLRGGALAVWIVLASYLVRGASTITARIQAEELVTEEVGAGRWPAGAAWIDGGYCPVQEAKISVLDLGVTRSDCTYDV